MSNPDWNFWLLMKDVSFWEAVALSLDIDPDSLVRDAAGESMALLCGPTFRSDSFSSRDIEVKFDKRLRLMQSNASTITGDQPIFGGGLTTLQQYAVWLASSDSDMPSEMMNLIGETALPLYAGKAPTSTQVYRGKAAPSNRCRQRQQQELIQEELEKLGYEMGGIPRGKPGKPGLRSQVHEKVRCNPLFDAKTSFGKAYDEVLKEDKEIANKKAYRHQETPLPINS
jgi:hypothetical protein